MIFETLPDQKLFKDFKSKSGLESTLDGFRFSPVNIECKVNAIVFFPVGICQRLNNIHLLMTSFHVISLTYLRLNVINKHRLMWQS